MKSFANKRIIVPWDFSDMSRDALNQALQMTDSPDNIDIVHVTPYPAVMEPGVVWGTIDEKSIRGNLTEYYRNNSDDAHKDMTFTVLFGDPGSEIARHAEEIHADLIVISSHGRSGLSRFFMGSVAERVTRLAPCPVLVLRGDRGESD